MRQYTDSIMPRLCRHKSSIFSKESRRPKSTIIPSHLLCAIHSCRVSLGLLLFLPVARLRSYPSTDASDSDWIHIAYRRFIFGFVFRRKELLVLRIEPG